MIASIKTIDITDKLYDEIVDLYSVFTVIDKKIFTIDKLKSIINGLDNYHDIYLYIHENKIIGAITLLIEQKIIHDGRRVGHLEDYVVLDNYRGKGYGAQLLDYATNRALENDCYKCILDCSPDLLPYYTNKKFMKKGIYMAKYF